MFNRRLAHLLAPALLALVLAPTSAAHAAVVEPLVYPPAAFDAPIGKPGGAMNPNATCGTDYSTTPRMRWAVTNQETGKVTSFAWFDAYPGMQFPRLAVGTYTSEATVRCRGNETTRTDEFTIKQKTPKSTISSTEFSRIKAGMTLDRVRTIVGNAGVWPNRYAGTTTRTFHQMKFWAWSVIEFRNGRVTKKYFNVGHD